MFLPGWLLLLTLIPAIFGVNPGVEVKLTEKGIEYGEQGHSRGFSPTCGSAAVGYQAFSLSRETAGSGCDTGKTQEHPSSGLFREKESFSDWKSRIQAVKVRRPSQKKQDSIVELLFSKTNMNAVVSIQIVDIMLPIAPVKLVPGSGVKLSINGAFINLRGNWRVKFLRRM